VHAQEEEKERLAESINANTAVQGVDPTSYSGGRMPFEDASENSGAVFALLVEPIGA
jgi:hypothetical protein